MWFRLVLLKSPVGVFIRLVPSIPEVGGGEWIRICLVVYRSFFEHPGRVYSVEKDVRGEVLVDLPAIYHVFGAAFGNRTIHLRAVGCILVARRIGVRISADSALVLLGVLPFGHRWTGEELDCYPCNEGEQRKLLEASITVIRRYRNA